MVKKFLNWANEFSFAKAFGPLYPFLKTVSLWLVFLTFFRILFSIYFIEHFQNFSEVARVFGNGIRVDLATSIFLIVIPVLIYCTLQTFFMRYREVLKQVLIPLLGLFGTVLFYLEVVSPWYIVEYGTRPERKFFEYLGTPVEVATMLWGMYGLGLVLIFVTTLAGGFWIFKRSQKSFNHHYSWSYRQYLLMFPMVLFLMLLAGRSSFDHRPLNPSMVAFSDDVIVNNLTLNSFYSLAYSIYRLKDEKDAGKIYGSLSEKEIFEIIPVKSGAIHKTPSIEGEAMNVVIILEESLGARYVDRLGGEALSPHLSQLSQEGWWFENMYATGTRSVRGLEAVITGFPPTPARSVVKLGGSQDNFFTLASVFKELGYENRFYYGGYAHFDNMKGFFLANGFEKVVEQPDFKDAEYFGSWGASDDDVFNQIHQDLLGNPDKRKFFATLTTSNHTPYDFPENFSDGFRQPIKSRENAVLYADAALGRFIEKAKQASYWENTIFLVVADHDVRASDFLKTSGQESTNPFPVEGFHIPALFIGGPVPVKTSSFVASQIDLPVTLLSLAGIKAENPMPGQDLTRVSKDYQGRAIMQFDELAAFLDGEGMAILKPYSQAMTGNYRKKFFKAFLVDDKSLAKKALAYELWASYVYKGKLYH